MSKSVAHIDIHISILIRAKRWLALLAEIRFAIASERTRVHGNVQIDSRWSEVAGHPTAECELAIEVTVVSLHDLWLPVAWRSPNISLDCPVIDIGFDACSRGFIAALASCHFGRDFQIVSVLDEGANAGWLHIASVSVSQRDIESLGVSTNHLGSWSQTVHAYLGQNVVDNFVEGPSFDTKVLPEHSIDVVDVFLALGVINFGYDDRGLARLVVASLEVRFDVYFSLW